MIANLIITVLLVVWFASFYVAYELLEKDLYEARERYKIAEAREAIACQHVQELYCNLYDSDETYIKKDEVQTCLIDGIRAY